MPGITGMPDLCLYIKQVYGAKYHKTHDGEMGQLIDQAAGL